VLKDPPLRPDSSEGKMRFAYSRVESIPTRSAPSRAVAANAVPRAKTDLARQRINDSAYNPG